MDDVRQTQDQSLETWSSAGADTGFRKGGGSG